MFQDTWTEMNKWDQRFMQLAIMVATWSKDPSSKTSTIIVTPDHRIVSVGFNGLPKGIQDSRDILHDREKKYAKIIHAEINAILFAQQDLTGCIAYMLPMSPCEQCASLLIQASISEIHHPAHIAPDKVERWGASLQSAYNDLQNAGVKMVSHTIPEDWYARFK